MSFEMNVYLFRFSVVTYHLQSSERSYLKGNCLFRNRILEGRPGLNERTFNEAMNISCVYDIRLLEHFLFFFCGFVCL